MQFKKHSHIAEGSHSTLSPSNYHWMNYDDAKFIEWFQTRLAASKGSRLHAFAAEAIALGERLPRSQRTLNAYVNDAISLRMTPEQVLAYSINSFGTADAIGFDAKKGFLRIHDLKTGITKASVHQLEVYAALFNLEYGPERGFKPAELNYELRIYQNDEVQVYEPDVGDIINIMGTIIRFDAMIEVMKEQADE